MKSVKDIGKLKNKSVLLRADLDVPLKKIGRQFKVDDDARLKDLLPTLTYLLAKQAKVILIGHLDRPQGKEVKSKSLKPVCYHLEKILNQTYAFKSKKHIQFIPIERYIGSAALKAVENLPAGGVVMLENLRFSDREEKNCKRFAKKLSSLGDIYVNNSFSTLHRKHASLSAIQSYLPVYYGLDVIQEIAHLQAIKQKPAKPLVLILGGAKVNTKLPVIKSFLNKADCVLVGGALANTFLKSLNFEIGRSLFDESRIQHARKIFNVNKIILPVDVVTQKDIKKVDQINKNDKIFDIGPTTVKMFTDKLKSAKTIIWNGPMGKFEEKKYAHGTYALARAISKSQAKNITIGGGDTHEAIKNESYKKNVFISSGGGAMLEYLAGNPLPGLKIKS